jgi:dCMP deaminase
MEKMGGNIKTMKEKECNHIYSRGLGEPRPRLCEHCKEPEVCKKCAWGWGGRHMCCPPCSGLNLSLNHTCTEFRTKKVHIAEDEIETVVVNSTLTKWDLRFIERAKAVSEYSKDKNTKTGAVIVNDDKTEITMGYNGFPRNADDDTDQRRYERPHKYFWTEHAERNAIYKAARLGVSTKDTKMYCTYFPCADCSRAIIQAGIHTLYTEKPDFNHHKWGESWLEALIMLKECGVEVVWTNDDGPKCEVCNDEGYIWEESGHPTHSRDYKVDCKCKS